MNLRHLTPPSPGWELRVSTVDRPARMPHQRRGPFPEAYATFRSRGRKAASNRKSSLFRRAPRRYSVRCPMPRQTVSMPSSCRPGRVTRRLLAATDQQATEKRWGSPPVAKPPAASLAQVFAWKQRQAKGVRQPRRLTVPRLGQREPGRHNRRWRRRSLLRPQSRSD